MIQFLLVAFSILASEVKLLKYEAKENKYDMYLGANQFRINIMDKNGKNSVIFDDTKKTVSMIDHSKKEFIKITEEQVKSMAKMMDQAMAMMQSLPEAMRKKIQMKQPQNQKPKPVTFKKMKSGVKVGKWTTDEFVAQREGKTESNLWIVPFKSSGIEKKDFKIMEKFGNFFSSMMGRFDKGGKSKNMQAYFQDGKIPGLPVKVVRKSEDLQFMLKEVKKVGSGAGLFVVPKGYGEKQLPM